MAYTFSFCFFLSFPLFIEILRVGSFNINGMRDRRKKGLLSEIIGLKDLSVVFVQETHSSRDNENEGALI